MICKICNIEMEIGQTLNCFTEENVHYLVGPPVGNSDTLELIDCWKCPKCGHSEDMEDIGV